MRMRIDHGFANRSEPYIGYGLPLTGCHARSCASISDHLAVTRMPDLYPP